MKTRMIGWLAVGGMSALLLGMCGLTPARADDDGYAPRGYHRDVRYDYRDAHRNRQDIRMDMDRLHDLYRARDREASRGDWRDVRRIDARIAALRADMRRDFRDVRREQRDSRADRYRFH